MGEMSGGGRAAPGAPFYRGRGGWERGNVRKVVAAAVEACVRVTRGDEGEVGEWGRLVRAVRAHARAKIGAVGGGGPEAPTRLQWRF